VGRGRLGTGATPPDFASSILPRQTSQSRLSGLFEKTIAEVAAAGRARGIRLPADIEVRMLQTIRNFPPEMMPSMAVDLLRGNRLELPWLAGKVVALGREVGVPTPTFDVMYAALKPYAKGAPA
jgi:2-dehydropantoate 2-reductase